MPLITLDALATTEALPMAPLVQALRAGFVRGAEVPPRQALQPGGPSGLRSLLMPAWTPGEHYGVKVVNMAPGNAARGLPGLHALYQLFDAVTGEPLMQLDGAVLTARRTAAASALAASFLARADASTLLVVGAGEVARLLPEAYLAVRPLRRVWLWARRDGPAQALCEHWRRQPALAGVAFTVVSDLGAAVCKADVVSCATLATEPLVPGASLRSGSHLDLIGSFTAEMREADDEAFRGARLFVDTEEALHKSGELLGPMSRGVFQASEVQATLAQLCGGTHPGRRSETERTVFKSVGTALEDLYAARLALSRLA